MPNQSEIQKLKLKTLKHFWSYPDFRGFQSEIIDSVLQGKDCLALLPTGGGKSLCYQVPALLKDGTALVVSPLIALMRDQVLGLQMRGSHAEFISAEKDDAEISEILEKTSDGLVKILYISPERLLNQSFIVACNSINFSLLAVDEAHCISEWGQDFRPSYQNIAKFRSLFPHIPCIALTATATEKVKQEIVKKLELRNPHIFQDSFERKNIAIIHKEISDKYDAIFQILAGRNQSGIIYTTTRKDAENLSFYLHNRGLKNVDFYHAGISTKEKKQKQEKWQKSDSEILISTNAFGMGIDKDNVRFVMHFSPSASLENYYQEIGRAGRDGAESFSILFWNEHELKNYDDILQNQIPTKSEFLTTISYLYSKFLIADFDSSEETFYVDLQNFAKILKISKAKIRNILGFLHNQEVLFFSDYFAPSSLQFMVSPEDLDRLPAKDSYFVEQLYRTVSGSTAFPVKFSEVAVSKKLGWDLALLKEKLQEADKKEFISYKDGSRNSVRFLQPRNDALISDKFWPLFLQIQKNKLQKWEEMKYFVKNNSICKNRMILSYFDEKNPKNCGKCSVCIKENQVFSVSLKNEITTILKQNPASIETFISLLPHRSRTEILEETILLLDSGEIKMLDFRTYMLNK